MNYDIMIIGIGNANYDLLVKTNNELIEKFNLNFGSAELVEKEISEQIINEIGSLPKGVAGGSVANSIAGIAGQGVQAGLIGKVANDNFGNEYKQNLKESEIVDYTLTADAGDTARCLCLITGENEDVERTMATYLGVAGELKTADINADEIAKADILLLEGYLVFNAKDALLEALRIAKENNVKVAFSLSATFCIDVMTDLVLEICKNSDIIFGNEEEWELLCNKGFKQNDGQVLVKTLAENGASVKTDNFEVTVPSEKVENIVDVTGAGDAFAAGFLAEYYKGNDLKNAAELGVKLASKVIQKIGGRI